MMGDKLPYSETSVPVSKSVSEIKSLLSDKAGCQQVLETLSNGKIQIVGIRDGLTYLFEFDVNHIAKKIADSRYYSTTINQKFLEKADRIGWRIIWHQVKHMAVCVQYGLISMERGFANHLVSVDQRGQLNYFADIVGEKTRSGELTQGNIAQALLPQSTGGNHD